MGQNAKLITALLAAGLVATVLLSILLFMMIGERATKPTPVELPKIRFR